MVPWRATEEGFVTEELLAWYERFARGRGRLDWATQPAPFRRFAGAPQRALPHGAYAGPVPAPVTAASVGELLRCALGLSAWKQYGAGRWSLRVNPSSGNLHPTEGYLLAGPIAGLLDEPANFETIYDVATESGLAPLAGAFWEFPLPPASDLRPPSHAKLHLHGPRHEGRSRPWPRRGRQPEMDGQHTSLADAEHTDGQ